MLEGIEDAVDAGPEAEFEETVPLGADEALVDVTGTPDSA